MAFLPLGFLMGVSAHTKVGRPFFRKIPRDSTSKLNHAVDEEAVDEEAVDGEQQFGIEKNRRPCHGIVGFA